MRDLKGHPKWGDGRTVERHFPGMGGKTRRYALLNQGLIRAKKHGRSTMFDLDSIDEYIEGLPDYNDPSRAAVRPIKLGSNVGQAKP